MKTPEIGNPAVSVIMLTYNREQYVGRAIDSILCQTFVDFEFIVVDNGSVDNSGAICDDYAEKDARINVIRKEKGNIGSGRNAGILAARGDYIAFVDDDDVAETDMIAFLYNLITGYQADISICGCWRSVDGTVMQKYIFDEIMLLDSEQAVVELLERRHYNVTFPCKMIKRELMIPPPFSEQGRYDDITTAYKVFAIAETVAAHGLPKYTFFRHDINNSKFSLRNELLDTDTLNEYLRAFKERTKYLSEKLPAIADYVRYSEWSFMISMCEKIRRFEIAGCEGQLELMTVELKKNRKEIASSPFLKDFERVWFGEL